MPEKTTEASVASQSQTANPNANPNPVATGHEDDPVMATLLEGLGIALGETPEAKPDPAKSAADGGTEKAEGDETPAAPAPEKSRSYGVGRTLAEIVKSDADATKESESAAQGADQGKSAGHAGGTPALPGETPAPAPAAAAVEETAPVAVEKRPSVDAIVQQTVNKVLGEQEARAKKEKEAAAPAADPFEAKLTDAEKEELEFAKYAAKSNPNRFGDYPQRVLDYLKKTDAYVQKARQENPERTFDDQDEDFQKFVKQNRPAIPPVERRRIETAKIKDEAIEAVRREKDAEMEELRRRQHQIETQPKIERAVQAYTTETEKFIASDEKSMAAPIVKLAREKGWDAVLQQDKIFAPIVKGLHDKSIELAAEYESLVSGVKQYSAKNPDHVWLVDFVRAQAEGFQRKGGAALVRDGRRFLPPREYNALSPEEREQHWSFSDRDVLERLAQNTKANIETAIKETEERFKASGWQRVAPTAAAPGKAATTSQPASQPPASPSAGTTGSPAPTKTAPKAGVTAAPGAGAGGSVKPANPDALETLRILNIPVKF